MTDIVKAVEQSEKIVAIFGLKITRPDRFVTIVVAIVVAAVLVAAVAGAGYWRMEIDKGNLQAQLSAAIEDFNEKLNAANKEFDDRINAASATLNDRLTAVTGELDRKLTASTTLLDTKLQSLEELASKTSLSLATLRDDMNGQIDGYWVPIPLRFGDTLTRVRFTLPIDPGRDVRALFIGEPEDQDKLQESVVIEVNGQPLDAPQQFVKARTPRPMKPKTDWSDDGFQNFEVYLKGDTARATLDNMKGNVALLVVVHRPHLGPATEENVPE